MIALHVGYKANIKAMHIAVQDFKGCGEKGGQGSEDGASMAPSGSPADGRGSEEAVEQQHGGPGCLLLLEFELQEKHTLCSQAERLYKRLLLEGGVNSPRDRSGHDKGVFAH
ncbi:hypothetical protein Q5P01_005843 [Channa striata]|uniref:Uncharacterized protein n=1 Tax=Channa striata TaxID=64152 RepID=A0AA88SYW9_CHASR|nr:hypothetical protein Q5P01_005843 [Channa striata]